MNKLYVGTSGWSYDHWKGVFYPNNLKAKNYLEYYANHFDSIEVNASFYRLPRKSTISGWKRSVSNEFMFCPKLSRFITHIKKFKDCEEPLREFLGVFNGLKEQLGPILIQLPQLVKYDTPRAKEFLQWLKRFWGHEFAIEARDKSWMTDKSLDFIQENKLSWVIADWGDGYPTRDAVTSDTVYLRFHGPGEEYASKYSKRQLKPFATKSKKWLSEGKTVWAFFNNDAEGYAVQNAQTFKEMVG